MLRIEGTINGSWNEGTEDSKHRVYHPTLWKAGLSAKGKEINLVPATERRFYVEITDCDVELDSALGRCIEAQVPIAIQQTNPNSGRFYSAKLTHGQVLQTTLEELFPESESDRGTGLSSEAIRKGLLSLAQARKIKNNQVLEILMLGTLREMRDAYTALQATLA